ncbi:MAG TPA: GNAT family N-acetyltransferase [Steroidobacteraceae bacterium]|nr:GNAT family N-acetyltransferase [Steroidobacteraceae bacterium]
MDDYRFEPAAPRDASRIAALSREFIENGLRPSWSAERILCHIKRSDSVVLTARFRGPLTVQLAGFAIMQFGDDRAHLNLLAVTPAHQRRGLGRRLMRWLHETAVVAGTFDLSLELRTHNVGARRFYESLGYRAGMLMPGYYQGQEDAQRMSCDLRVNQGQLTA